MKMIFLTLALMACTPAFADFVNIRRPVGLPDAMNTATSVVTATDWNTFDSSVGYACSAVLIHNSGSQPIKMGVGVSGSVVDTGLVFPINVSALVPIIIQRGSRLSLKSLGATQNSGIITQSCFQ